MTPAEWGAITGLALALVAGLAWYGLSGGAMDIVRRRPLVCPWLQVPVSCSFVQDFRTGRLKQVLECSAFVRPRRVACDQDCRKIMNLGFRPEDVPPVRLS